MLKLISFALTVILSVSTVTACASNGSPIKPLEVGIIPYLSPRVLIKSYEPMRLYLENTLGRPVKIYTATNFKQFLLRAQHGDYDLVLAAAHFARILELDQKYIPVARFETLSHTLIVTAKNSPLKTVEDLQNQVIAAPDLLSLSSIVAFHYLQDAGLKLGSDFIIQEVPTFISAILSVQKGEAAAAITATGIIGQMPKKLRDSVTTIIDAGESLRIVILVHPRLEKNTSVLIKQALLKMSRDPVLGEQILNNTHAGDIIAVTADDMKTLDRYLPETRRLLAKTP
ncbi:MAG: phosphate/phosphite/phosphonate ABC transporter substrate-binding protein [Gallionellaceae bacterium]|jgi:phosphonate transport system substrate-binding protein